MDREKEIAEMALALSEGGCGKECNCTQNDKFNCHLLYNATVLYNAGYRKASEVAREIIGEILLNHTPDIDGFFTIHESELAKIKNKYTEE